MRSRSSVVMVALLLAITATLAVFLYVEGVQEQAKTGGGTVEVVVSEEDIAAGTALNDLIESGVFTTLPVTKDSLVDGAVTELADLKDRTTGAPILAGEQISTARLQGTNELPGGNLGIPNGYAALSFSLELPRVAGGAIQPGDHVTAYGTFSGSATQGGPTTVTLVPDIEVLNLVRPATRQTTSANPNVMVTLALRPRDAQKLVFAQEQGSVWLALQPPNQKGSDQRPTNLLELIR
jgi:pilus assembly protein CpaB